MDFEPEIKKLGLSDKETSVYLAALELGAAPVQPIAKKAKVARATTYLVLEALMQRGLVNRHKEGKKTLFQAEPPQKLIDFIATEEQVLHQRRADLEQVIPRLQALMHTLDDKPTVEYFDGVDGLRTIRQLMLRASDYGDVWYNFTPIDAMTDTFKDEKEALFYAQRRAKGIVSYAIIVTDSKKNKKRLMEEAKKQNSNRKFVSTKVFTSDSSMTVYGDNIAIGKYDGNKGGIIITSPQMAQLLRDMFKYIWSTLP